MQTGENDIKCVVATGRHLMELSELPVKDMDFDGYITLNGQLCLDDKKAVFHSVPIPETEKRCILSLFEQNRIPVMLVEKDAMYINFINERVRQAQQAISTALPDVGSYTGAEIYQAIAFIDKSEEVKACADHITSDVDKDGIENALKHYGILK